jgi:molybdenum cofactor cytidylyltransferase
MFRLAGELAQARPARMRVLTTTSTRIFGAQIKRSPAHIIFKPQQQTLDDILPQLEAALLQHSQVLLVGETEAETGKAFGVPPEVINALAATGRFDVILNEADGSRMRPFKAPAAHEPVIPDSTTVVTPVVGLDIVGQPLNDETVHRAALVSQLSGTALDQPITVDTITAILCHPAGGLKNAPPQARITPLLNKAESPDRLAAARQIAAKLLDCAQIEAVVLGAMQARETPVIEVHGRTAAIILAAGASTRFGSPKQLARWGRQTFIERAVDTALASQARPVFVVLGAEIERSQAALRGRPVQIIVNPDWAKGQSSSMKAGLAALPAGISSAVFLLVDLPGVTPDVIDALITAHRRSLAPLVWPEFEGQRGNPVLFDRALFPELMQVSGDTGGRPVLMAYQDQAERVTVNNQAVLLDYDRPEDLPDPTLL